MCRRGSRIQSGQGRGEVTDPRVGLRLLSHVAILPSEPRSSNCRPDLHINPARTHIVPIRRLVNRHNRKRSKGSELCRSCSWESPAVKTLFSKHLPKATEEQAGHRALTRCGPLAVPRRKNEGVPPVCPLCPRVMPLSRQRARAVQTTDVDCHTFRHRA
jgi:hypothetical protein